MAGLPLAPLSPAQCIPTAPGAGHKHLQMPRASPGPQPAPNSLHRPPCPITPHPPPCFLSRGSPTRPCQPPRACPAPRTGSADHQVGGIQQDSASPAAVVARGWQVQARDGESLSLSVKLGHELRVPVLSPGYLLLRGVAFQHHVPVQFPHLNWR